MKLVRFYWNSHSVARLLLTGIFEVRRNSSRASNDPRVEACTYTPRSDSLMAWSVSRSKFDTSSCWEAEYRKLWSTAKNKIHKRWLSGLVSTSRVQEVMIYCEKDLQLKWLLGSLTNTTSTLWLEKSNRNSRPKYCTNLVSPFSERHRMKRFNKERPQSRLIIITLTRGYKLNPPLPSNSCTAAKIFFTCILVCLRPVGISNNVICYVQFELFVSVVCSAPPAFVL